MKKITAAGSLIVAMLCGPSQAEVLNYHVVLSPASVFPSGSIRSAASGSVNITFDTTTSVLKWQGQFSGLTTPISAHIHGGSENEVGVVLVNVFDAQSAASPFSGSTVLPQTLVAYLMAGRLYFDIHTQQNQVGEIRGQIK